MAHRQAYLAAAQNSGTNIFITLLLLRLVWLEFCCYLESQKMLKSPAKEDWLIAGLVHDIIRRYQIGPSLSKPRVLSALGLEISQDIDSIVKARPLDNWCQTPKSSGLSFAPIV